MSEPCRIIPFRPAQVQERDNRVYQERDSRVYQDGDLKQILYAFARDYERRRKIDHPMRADALRKFINLAFLDNL